MKLNLIWQKLSLVDPICYSVLMATENNQIDMSNNALESPSHSRAYDLVESLSGKVVAGACFLAFGRFCILADRSLQAGNRPEAVEFGLGAVAMALAAYAVTKMEHLEVTIKVPGFLDLEFRAALKEIWQT